MFNNCSGLTSLNVTGWDTSSVTNMNSTFQNCAALASITGLDTWDTGSVTQMEGMFVNCSSLTSISSIANWNVSSVKYMSAMFSDCSSLLSADLHNWNTGSLNTMTSMFNGCSSLQSVNLSGWDTSKVTKFGSLFKNCASLSNANLHGWSLASSANASDGVSYMFDGCASLKTLDLSSWQTHGAVMLDSLFYSASGLESVNVTGWDTSTVTGMSALFAYCTNLRTITGIGGWDVSNVTSSYYGGSMDTMFQGCTSLTSLDLSGWGAKTANVLGMSNMFKDCANLETLNVTGWNMGSVTTMYGMFNNCAKLRQITGINAWNPASVTTTALMFNECRSLPALDLSGWRPVSLQTLQRMFWLCENMTTLNLNGFKPADQCSLYETFGNCRALTSLDVSGWNVGYLEGTFARCYALRSLDVSGWNTSTVQNMSYTFYFCESLTDLRGINGWDVSSATNMNLMFTLCGFTSLDLSNWNLNKSNYIAMGGMFTGCRHLSSLDISGWDMSMVGIVNTIADMQLYKFFGYCDNLTQIKIPLNLSAELQTDLPAEFTRQDDPSATYTVLPTEQTVSYTIVRGPIPFGTPTFTLPAGTTAVEANAFEGAYMSIVSIPAGCQSIGDHAFKDCVALVQIRIPDNCTLGADVFDGCVSVTVYGTTGSPAELYCQTHDNCTFVAE
ncbi:MAG: BspA family leucine-rich repeat surface protein [Clostridia bacterium]|nr:BspA family leucine-rich repeat surface protein [Clostridia bacterium]